MNAGDDDMLRFCSCGQDVQIREANRAVTAAKVPPNKRLQATALRFATRRA